MQQPMGNAVGSSEVNSAHSDQEAPPGGVLIEADEGPGKGALLPPFSHAFLILLFSLYFGYDGEI